MSGVERLRLFVAFDVPSGLLDELQRQIADLREQWPDARWTPVEIQHVTLRFLGWADRADLEAIGSRLAEVARSHSAGSLELGELGAFPSPGRARVLWAGIRDRAGLTPGLAADLDLSLEALGFEPERRGFTPHLTLARFKTPRRLGAELFDRALPDGRFDLTEMVLYRSHLSPKGPRYEQLASFALASGEEPTASREKSSPRC